MTRALAGQIVRFGTCRMCFLWRTFAFLLRLLLRHASAVATPTLHRDAGHFMRNSGGGGVVAACQVTLSTTLVYSDPENEASGCI